jgi:hypothetical protein
LALISGGGSLINYDPKQPSSSSNQLSISTQITISTGGKNTHEQTQLAQIKEESEAIDRAQSGTSTTSAAPVTNDNYANGTSTGASVNNDEKPTSDDNMAITLNASGAEVNLGTIEVTPVTYSSITETFGAEYSTYLAYTYEAFTYTNIGGVYDVGYQYHNGAIGGWYAAGQLGMAALFGGAGVKAYKAGFSSFNEARALYSNWGVGSFDSVCENIRHHSNKRGNGN